MVTEEVSVELNQLLPSVGPCWTEDEGKIDLRGSLKITIGDIFHRGIGGLNFGKFPDDFFQFVLHDFIILVAVVLTSTQCQQLLSSALEKPELFVAVFSS